MNHGTYKRLKKISMEVESLGGEVLALNDRLKNIEDVLKAMLVAIDDRVVAKRLADEVREETDKLEAAPKPG